MKGTTGRAIAPNATTSRTIAGNPLTIIIGDDTSIQALNSTFPGNGQFFPTTCTTSPVDAGIFAAFGGTLYAPNFSTNCGTATGNIGTYTPWTPVSISAVSGAGTAASPFQVTVVVDAAATGVRLTAVYSYVNGDQFFRLTKTFTSTAAQTMNIYLAGDIYLASSDNGVPYLEPTSSSPGGKDCVTGTYTILFVPTTPASRFTARDFSAVWAEIGTHGDLTNVVAAGCQDNGAALEWKRTLAAGGTTTITSAISFGAIPAIALFRVDSVSPAAGNQGQTLTVTVTGVGFQAGTTFDFGAGITVSGVTITNSTTATMTLSIASSATPGFRDVIGTQSPGGLTSTLTNGFQVLALAAVVPASLTCPSGLIQSGATGLATVTLTGAAPPGGLTVTLGSSAPAIATVPATVIVPAGSTSTTFAVTPLAQGSTTLSASAGGTTVSCTLSVGATAVSGVGAPTLDFGALLIFGLLLAVTGFFVMNRFSS